MILETDIELIELLSGGDIASQKETSKPHFYFTNRDGTIRWIYPADLEFPSFLNFFNQSSTRAKLYGLLLKIVFYLNTLLPILVKKHHIRVAGNSILKKILSRHPDCKYSIFMGTVGHNRKIIIEVNNNKRTSAFVKLGVSSGAVTLVENECRVLMTLCERENVSFRVPRVLNHTKGMVEISNINFEGAYQSSDMLQFHLEAIEEFSSIGSSYIQYNQLKARDEVIKNIGKLEDKLIRLDNLNGIDLGELLVELRAVSDFMRCSSVIPCGLSH